MTFLTEIPTDEARRIARHCRASDIITPGQWLHGTGIDAFGEAHRAKRAGQVAEAYSLLGKDGTMVVLARQAPAEEHTPSQLSLWSAS